MENLRVQPKGQGQKGRAKPNKPLQGEQKTLKKNIQAQERPGIDKYIIYKYQMLNQIEC